MHSRTITTRFKTLFLVFLVYFSFSESVSFTQEVNYFIRRYTTEHGLVNNHVRDIVKDKSGFLWIATFDGLSRFDGYEFTNYYHDPNDKSSLAAIDLLRVCVDKQNNVWIFGGHLLCRYNRDTENFNLYSFDSQYKIASKIIWNIAVDHDSIFWIFGDSGFEKYDSVTGRFILYQHPLKNCLSKSLSYTDLLFDHNNRFWLLTDSVFIFTGHTDTSHQSKSYDIDHCYRMERRPYILNLEFQAKLISDKDGTSWITSNYGLYRLDTSRSLFVKAGPDDLKKNGSFHDPVVWSELDKGFFIYDRNNDTMLTIHDLPVHIGKGRYEDQRVFWFGGLTQNSEGLGLIEVILNSGGFKHIFIKDEDDQKEAAIFGLIKDLQGNIWAGARGEPYLLRITPYGVKDKCNYVEKKYLKGGNHIRALEMVNGMIWVGFLTDYAYRFDPSASLRKLRIVQPDQQIVTKLPANQISYRVIKQDAFNNVIIGGDNTLMVLDPSTCTVLKEYPFPGPIYCIYQDTDSNIWIAVRDSLYVFDKTLTHAQSLQLTRGSYNIESIVEGDQGILWLALMGGGVGRYDKDRNKLNLLTQRSGLSNNFTYDLLKDDHGNLWISSNAGLSMLNTQTLRFRNFGKSDGLLIEEFNADAAYESADGEMIFGGMGGIVRFYPDSVLGSGINYPTVPLVITSLKASGETDVIIPDIYEKEGVELPKGMLHISISFACLDYRNADDRSYRYRCRKISSSWVEVDNKHRYVNFTGLRPGQYTFELQATDLFGNWTKNRTLEIFIPPFFYQTTWFKLLIAGFVFISLIILLAMRRRQEMLKEQRKAIQLKLDSLRNQLNPHFLFNSLNSINFFISNNDKLSANQYISGFSRLMRAILTNSGSEFIPLEKEIEALEDYCRLEHLRFGDKFDYQITVDPSINFTDTEITPTMVQPFIENAIWHGVRWLEGRKGFIEISFHAAQADFIVCRISDNGIGRKLSAARKSEEQRRRRSKGIAIIRERLEMINAIRKVNCQIRMEDLHPGKEETGTLIIIEIPVKKASP